MLILALLFHKKYLSWICIIIHNQLQKYVPKKLPSVLSLKQELFKFTGMFQERNRSSQSGMIKKLYVHDALLTAKQKKCLRKLTQDAQKYSTH
jgi:hypothetical protein